MCIPFPHSCSMLCPSNPTSQDHPNYTCKIIRIQSMKQFVMQFWREIRGKSSVYSEGRLSKEWSEKLNRIYSWNIIRNMALKKYFLIYSVEINMTPNGNLFWNTQCKLFWKWHREGNFCSLFLVRLKYRLVVAMLAIHPCTGFWS
jgi:hypothetical protein